MKDALVVNVEKVRVEPSLQQARQHDNQLWRPSEKVTIDPVEDVERAIHSKTKQIVRRDGLRLSRLLQLKHLGEDGH